jgi:hypothetical protein
MTCNKYASGQYIPLFSHAVTEQFVKPVHRRIVVSDNRPESLVNQLLAYELPLIDKWIDLKQT